MSRASVRIAQDVRTRAFSGGLKDQDRIFQNIYGEHDKSIQGVMKRGDWYQTDKIVQKVREAKGTSGMIAKLKEFQRIVSKEKIILLHLCSISHNYFPGLELDH